MPFDFVKFSYAAGELSPDLHGRGDLEGFQFGYREGLNVMVDWRGSVKTRPGTIMCEPLFEDVDNPGVRLSTFSFNADPEDNYLLVWLHRELRLVQEGKYLVVDTTRAGNTLTDNFSVGDIVRVYQSSSDDTYLFTGQVKDNNTVYVPYQDAEVDLAAARQVREVYKINTPYSAEDIHDLKFEQFRDQIIISHRAYAARYLERTLSGGDPVFRIREQTFLNVRQTTGKVSVEQTRTNAFAANTGGFQWAVGIVDEDGREYPIPFSDARLEEDVDIGTKYLDLSWDADSRADSFNIYASSFKPGFSETASPILGTQRLTRNPARDLTLFSYNIVLGGATFFDGNIWALESVGAVGTVSKFDTDGNVLTGSFNGDQDSHIGCLTHDDTYLIGVDHLNRVFYYTTAGTKVNSLSWTLPTGSWRGGTFANGWLWFLDSTAAPPGNRIAKVDPVARTVDSYISLPVGDWNALVTDGITLWVVNDSASNRIMKAYNFDLEDFTPALDVPHTITPVEEAFHIPTLDEVHIFRTLGDTAAYNLEPV